MQYLVYIRFHDWPTLADLQGLLDGLGLETAADPFPCPAALAWFKAVGDKPKPTVKAAVAALTTRADVATVGMIGPNDTVNVAGKVYAWNGAHWVCPADHAGFLGVDNVADLVESPGRYNLETIDKLLTRQAMQAAGNATPEQEPEA